MKKLFILAIAGLIGMAVLGAGYAMWSDTLTINGTVQTGTVDAQLSIEAVTELVNGGPEDPAKASVANCTAALATDTADTGTGGGVNDILNIAVTGAYPSYTCKVTFDVHSIGTVPVHVDSPKGPVSPATPNPNWVVLENCYQDEVQLHQGDKALCTISIHFTNNDRVAQGGSYSFSYSIIAHQYNEALP